MQEFLHNGKEKKKFIKKMFDDISSEYDFLNTFLSFGIDKYWRKKFLNYIKLKKSSVVLDVACGTSDIGLYLYKKYSIQLICLDYSLKMLEIGKKKAIKKGFNEILFVQGDAENLPISNNSIDVITIAYGLRNLGDYDKAFKEFYRVLKPNGMLGVLEFSQPKYKIITFLFNIYFNKVLPKLASIFSKSYAYRYLPESVSYFPKRDIISKKILNAGFKKTNYIDLTMGISTIFLGYKD